MSFPKIVSLNKPNSPLAEAYRTLRTNIQFSSLDEKMRVILITSSIPGEGKTTTSCNLAAIMASAGHKTLLIDCDLRRPSVHKKFEVSNQIGLSNIMVGSVSMEEAEIKTEIDNLTILTSGVIPPNPSELLASSKMKEFINALKDKFDYIIIDSPPVLMVTDAQIISRFADGCMLVVASGGVQRELSVKAKELLLQVNARLIGVILNKFDTSSKGYLYGYYKNSYYRNDSPMEVKSKSKLGFFSRLVHKTNSY